MSWLECRLFPQSRFLNFIVIVCLSGVFSYLLTGKQIALANWGMIDDHEMFTFLGPNLHLAPGDIWNTLLTKTEIGTLQGRFRPSYYLLKVIEAAAFGPNVHLWYLVNTVSFAIFLASIWWTTLRFAGIWLSGALTASIALLSLWADVWSRLGPSEIFGAASVGIMLFGADLVLFSGRPLLRNVGAVIVTLAAITLAGLKETFVPLAAGGPALIFILAVIERRLSRAVIAVLSCVILGCIGAIGFVVSKELHVAGADYYGRSIGPGVTLLYAVLGGLDGLLRTVWLWALPLVFLSMLKVVPQRPLAQWMSDSRMAIGIYLFLIAMYAAQCGLYRNLFPQNMRYDFPAMLLIPATACVLACEVSCRLRDRFPQRVINYAQLVAAVFLIFALVNANIAKPPPALAVAVKKNIESTSAFFDEVQRLVAAAKEAPDSPVILEAHGPRAFEAVHGVPIYLRALGVANPVSVRFHRDEQAKGALYDRLQASLAGMQDADSQALTPLAKSLAGREKGCLSVGLYGPPDSACKPFEMSSSN
jgi:hypothetical protein